LGNLFPWLLRHKFLVYVVFDQQAGNHLNQITACFVWADESDRTPAPTFVLNELVIPTPMILVSYIKGNQWTSVELEFTHLDLVTH
jgi:hypothetical protein